MLTEERFAKILSILEHMGSVTVQQLMTELDASESTVRRDLNTLDANGQLVKVHGGAILKNTVYSTIDDAVFVTNAIGHAKKLAEHGCKVYILGGEFKAVTEAIVGEEAVFTLDKYNFTKGFWGANGVSLQRGFSTPELKEAMVKRKSMENCRDCYILADESKFSQISSVTFAPFEKATVITTELKQEIYKDCSNIINIE